MSQVLADVKSSKYWVYPDVSCINNETGSGNLFLGYSAGLNELGSNQLYIENSDSATPLIGGNFSNDEVVINGSLGIGITSPEEKLHIQGSLFEKNIS